MSETSIYSIPIFKVTGNSYNQEEDILAVEEPMEIRIVYGKLDQRQRKSLSVTMRTPGNDFELTIGFLYAESIITSKQDILKIEHCQNSRKDDCNNVVIVELHPNLTIDLKKTERNFNSTSACGLCGKTSIEAVFANNLPVLQQNQAKLPISFFYTLTEKLLSLQTTFDKTGGLHAAALFDTKGNLKIIQEDIGRHNALDKVIGAALMSEISLPNHILLLSGRAGFELVQKALVAGIPIVAAIGAPSSLAIELAVESSMTLIGFLRKNRLNVYSGEGRIIFGTVNK